MGEPDRLLFCNVSHLEHYNDTLDAKPPKHGGSYPEEKKTGGEINNFKPRSDGCYHGFFEPGYSRKFSVHIERIDRSYKSESKIPDVTVVFCAQKDDQYVIVGWYKHATIYRKVQSDQDGAPYNLVTKIENAILLPEEKRVDLAPRANYKKYNFGFGRCNFWYADAGTEEVNKYRQNVLKLIEDYGKSKNCVWVDIPETTFIESGIAYKYIAKAYKRNAAARDACLKIHGYKCQICGFDGESFYGTDFKKVINVHHIVPISQTEKEGYVDPAVDLMPVCPNCHMALHTKVNGKYPSCDDLIKLLKSKKQRGGDIIS